MNMALDVDTMLIEHNRSVRFVNQNSDEVFAYAIGDVHGCFAEMKLLIEKCEQHAMENDRQAIIYLLGDVIDRGPVFLDIMQYIHDNDHVACILGNHELNFYLEVKGNKECRSKARRLNHNKFEDYSKADRKMIMKTIGEMPNAVFLGFDDQDPEIFLTHAPIRNIEYINNDDILNNTNGPQCCMRSTPVDMKQLDKTTRGAFMVHGHQSWNYKPVEQQLEEQAEYSNRVINLDSGCVYGEKLTALCINTMEVLDVDALNVYAEH